MTDILPTGKPETRRKNGKIGRERTGNDRLARLAVELPPEDAQQALGHEDDHQREDHADGDQVVLVEHAREDRYDPATTASTNQCNPSRENLRARSPGISNGGWRKVSPFSPPVTSVQVKMIT